MKLLILILKNMRFHRFENFTKHWILISKIEDFIDLRTLMNILMLIPKIENFINLGFL
jgi:hypothetical protein